MISRRSILLSAAALPFAGAAVARAPEMCCSDGIALGGNDAVSYHYRAMAVAGRPEYSLMWRDAVWQFESYDNMSAFEMDPWSYAPQFGGYCALGMSQGRLYPGDPSAWRVHMGKLYVCQSEAFLNIWMQAPESFIGAAERNWPDILWA